MFDLWLIVSLIGGILVGWVARSYLGNQFIKHFYEMQSQTKTLEEAVRKANAGIVEKQRYVGWILVLVILIFTTGVMVYDSPNTSDITISIQKSEKRPAKTETGLKDAAKQLGF